MALVSICIPAFNQPDYLKRLLESIFIQTFSNYEIIITDDSKTDKIRKLVEFYSDIRIQYCKNSQSLGSPNNWNFALQRATGKYIKIMHHDDWFKDAYSLEHFVNSIEENYDSFVFCQSDSYNFKGFISSNCPTNDIVNNITTNVMQLFLSNDIGDPSTTIFKKNEFQFDENLKWFVDIEFYIRMIKSKGNIFYIKKPLVCVGVHPDQVTNECIHDKKLIYNEFLYSFNKLYNQRITSKFNFYKVFYLFLIRNPVQSYRELKDYAQSGLDYLQIIIFHLNYWTQNIKRYARSFKLISFF